MTEAMSTLVDRIGANVRPSEYQQVRRPTESSIGRCPRSEDDEDSQKTAAYDGEGEVSLPSIAPKLTSRRRLPEQTELGGPNQDIALGDAVKVARAWKSSSQYPKIELFRGDTDARGIRQFFSLVSTTQAYRFANTAEQYFYAYRLLDGKPARVVDKHMKHFRDACSFGDLLKEFWKVLYNEYSSSGDYFQVRRRLMTLRMSLGGNDSVISRYEDYCDEFMNLAEQLLDDNDLGENAYRKEVAGYFLHGLEPAITRRIERDHQPGELEVLPFNQLKRKARSICGYLASKKSSSSSSGGGQVNEVSVLPSLNQNSGKTTLYSRLELSNFRCQKCRSQDHATYACQVKIVPGLSERCNKCGLKHLHPGDALRCKARDGSQMVCVRCRQILYLRKRGLRFTRMLKLVKHLSVWCVLRLRLKRQEWFAHFSLYLFC